MAKIHIKRAYDDAKDQDGYRILVDRLWPRGIKKEDLHHDEWFKGIAPSSDLRKDFDHEDDKFTWFKEHYEKELNKRDEDVQAPGVYKVVDLKEIIDVTELKNNFNKYSI